LVGLYKGYLYRNAHPNEKDYGLPAMNEKGDAPDKLSIGKALWLWVIYMINKAAVGALFFTVVSVVVLLVSVLVVWILSTL
jgi:hypothetical protein